LQAGARKTDRMTRPLRIGVNALYLIPGAVGGTEIYLRSLLRALEETDDRNEYFIYVNAETAGSLSVDSPRFRIVECNVKASFRPARIVWEQTFLPWLLKRHRIDIAFNPGFTAPVLFGGSSVTVFHDLQYKRHPEFFRWFDLPFWNLLLWLSAVRSRVLIAVSQATADDLGRYYPRAAHKTVVIHHGVDPEFFRIGERRRAATVNRNHYILTVSTLHPHKNLDRLLESFRLFHSSHAEFRLVIAGLKGFAAEQLAARRRELGLEDHVRFTGWIPRPELYGLFEGASAFIAPSKFEGFGMPLLEALAAGIPCACAAIPPFDEVAGSAAARFDPGSVPAIAAAIGTAACDCAFRLRAEVAGPEQARRFDWKETAKSMRRQFEAIHGSHASSAK
jgi:glycosyltransferase involved in cell wall biosynthesis